MLSPGIQNTFCLYGVSSLTTLAGMPQPPTAFKFGSLVWSLVVGGVVIFIGGAILLPSTKSSRLGAKRVREMAEQRQREQDAAEAAAAAAPTSGPATEPTTVPSTQP